MRAWENTSWRVVGGPEALDHRQNRRSWRWEIESEDGTRRSVFIYVTSQATSAPGRAAEEAASASVSRGQSALEGVLRRTEPPTTIVFSAQGRLED